MRDYRTVRALRGGAVIDFDGIKLKMDVDENGVEKEIKPGDLYVAERNTGPHLLTARRVSKEFGCIYPTDISYAFAIGECVKVCEA